jgi:hypothetical protein
MGWPFNYTPPTLFWRNQPAITFVRAHYPEVDLELLKTLPPSPSGRIDMEHHYAACRGTADCIAQQIITESDR